MSLESIISLLLNIPIGLISGFIIGLYTGLVATRYSRFSGLRNEALRSIQIIGFINEKEYIDISNVGDLEKIYYIASNLEFLGHKQASKKTFKISKEIELINREAKNGEISYPDYEKKFYRGRIVFEV